MEKRILIEPNHPEISIIRQCELIGLSRSSYYYHSFSQDTTPQKEVDNHMVRIVDTQENLCLMGLIDRQYMKAPFYGSRRMTEVLREKGYHVNRKRIQRLMRQMGIQAIYPKPRLSKGDKGHKIYPYLLRNVSIDHVNQVWSSDITYVPIRHGFMYLVAIIDWYSRYVLSWQLSNTLETFFCLEALKSALEENKPEIFNTDQGVQFTSTAYTNRLKEAEIQISMDGRGRAFDNIFIERLWRSVKYENIYIHDYQTVSELIVGLETYFRFYNQERPHQSLDYQTPEMVHWGLSFQRTG